jgi:hypothetical protein
MFWNRKKSTTETIEKENGSTIVYMRSCSPPVQFWEAKVYYDAWGTPYVKGNPNAAGPEYRQNILTENGRTLDGLWKVEWKHKSGPEVNFSRIKTREW